MSTNILYTSDGRRIVFDMPDAALDLIEELVDSGAKTEIAVTQAAPLIIAAELRRIATKIHELAQTFGTAHLKTRKEDHLAFAALLKQRATALDGEA